MARPRKPLAADRTIDIFTGKSNHDALEVAIEDVEEQDSKIVRSSETIEQAADRWRNQAFTGQEWTTLLFGKAEAGENQYRTSIRDGYCYLEKQGYTKVGRAYSYAGVMFPEDDLPRLARVMVDAAKAYLDRKKNNADG
jgi:hypothetical protein